MKKLDSVAVITGGGGDLAQELGAVLAEAGMNVLGPSRAELDVTSAEDVKAYFSHLEGLDLLICNAGVTDDRLMLKMDEASWDRVVDVNLRGAYLTAKSAAKMMFKRRAGHIVFISSHSAYHPPVGQASYASAKAALDGLAKSMAVELGSRNVRVNVVVPGFMDTKMTSDLAEEVKISALSKHCLQRYNEVSAVAKFIRTLHLDMVHTSGQVFHLDSRIV